jgi:hypothetical protein
VADTAAVQFTDHGTEELKETYVKVCIGKYLSDNFAIQNGLKEGDSLSPLVSQICFRI